MNALDYTGQGRVEDISEDRGVTKAKDLVARILD